MPFFIGGNYAQGIADQMILRNQQDISAAQVEDTKAQAMQRLMQAMVMKKTMDMQERLRQDFAAQTAGELHPAPGTQQSDDFAGYTGAVDDPLSLSYRAITSDIAANKAKANAYQKAGAFNMAEKYDNMAREGMTNLREISGKIYDKGEAKFKEAAQVMQSVKDPQGYDNALRYLVQNFPRKVVDPILRRVSFDSDGIPVYDNDAKALVTSLNSQFTTGHEKITERQGDKRIADEEARAQQSHQDRVDARQDENKRFAQSQALGYARLAEQKKRTEIIAGTRKEKDARDAEKTAQNDLGKEELVKNFDKYRQAYLAAKNVTNQIKTGSLRDTTTPEIQNMVRGFDQQINNFRSFMGAGVQVKQDEAMQGALQRIRAYFTTIGQGKKPDIALVKDIAAEVGRVYQDTNAQVAKKTLLLRERVWKKSGDPDAVVSPAQLNEAIRTGRAAMWSDPKDGQKYVNFAPEKKVPDKEDLVPYYDKPKERKKFPLSVTGGDEE